MPEVHSSKLIIRRATPRDEKRWRELFDGYCLFYNRTPSELLTRHTWARIMDVPTNRHGGLLKSMRHTLEHLKTAAESGAKAGGAQ